MSTQKLNYQDVKETRRVLESKRIKFYPKREDVVISKEMISTIEKHLQNYQDSREGRRFVIEAMKCQNKEVTELVNSYIDKLWKDGYLHCLLMTVLFDDFVPKDWWRIFLKFEKELRDRYNVYLDVKNEGPEHLKRETLRIAEAREELKKASMRIENLKNALPNTGAALTLIEEAEACKEEIEKKLKRRNERKELISSVIKAFSYEPAPMRVNTILDASPIYA